MNKVKKVVILASGGGSNARKIAEYFQGSKRVEISAIACNKPNAGVWQVASDFDIATFQITRDNFDAEDGFHKLLNDINPDLIVLAGFLWKIPESITRKYGKKMINIHPALLPNYGGKGMYGRRVHEAVHANKEKYTGITIHYVNEEYDKGHIVFQKIVELNPADSVDDIESKIHRLEHENFPLVIDFILRNDH